MISSFRSDALNRRLLVFVFVALAVGNALLIALALLVMWRAEDAAAGRAYCVEVPIGSFEYGPVTRLRDLLAYSMRAGPGPHGDYLNFHAVLFAERPEARIVKWGQPLYERFNWSYRRLRFVRITGQGHAALGDTPACTPVPRFFSTLLLSP
ncbi:MAG: hypothetical protein KDJ72_09035 [Methyloceanibacter sp.]|nr:hypothetical protein [Methyloceanibacter sp.]